MKLPSNPQFTHATFLQSMYDLIPKICQAFNRLETHGLETVGTIIIDTATTGVVFKDTQGTPHYWRLTVTNAGALVTTDLGTTKPSA
ncbi:MAG: hypothetical protein ND866_31150 [Pyrinomonadaceae bacterium]|nr:hypothetical protein [Pyrinomonadaceae bacterium]